MTWEDAMRDYLTRLTRTGVIYCGDLNVAHNEIDLKNPKPNRGNAGFTDEEREKSAGAAVLRFCGQLPSACIPDAVEYSWWSYIGHARDRNAGWRIDYFTVSERLMPRVIDSQIHQEIFGSDHCLFGGNHPARRSKRKIVEFGGKRLSKNVCCDTMSL